MKTEKAGLVVDPVCGMKLEPSQAAGMSRLNGRPFYFCSARCNAMFDAAPSRFVGESTEPPTGSCCRESARPCH